MKPKFFSSKLAVANFIILIASFIILHSVAFFLSSVYWRIQRTEISHERLAQEIIKLANAADNLEPQQFYKIQSLLHHPGLRVRLENQPLPNTLRLFSFDVDAIHQTVSADPRKVKISFELKNNKWLNVTSAYHRPVWLFIGLGSVAVLMIIVLIAVCFWVIKRMLMPLEQFTQAVNRFGRDVSAPPLPIAGPESFRAATQAFNDMQARIRQLLNDRTQMLAAISHDLRTPITRLKLRTENLSTDVQQKMLNDLTEMEHMINSILSFARDYTRDEPVEKFDLKALLETICDDMVDVGKNVKLITEFNRLPYSGRLHSLKRALTNIIDNAVKYGKIAEIHLQLLEKQVQIKVSDEGPGIPETEMENVFRPFYRIDSSRSPKTTGSGLGLTVARDIILAHGGTIKLLNRQPNGLCVTIELPL